VLDKLLDNDDDDDDDGITAATAPATVNTDTIAAITNNLVISKFVIIS
jgi:hypothetical protein